MARGVMAYTLPLLISLSVAGAFSPDSVVLRGSKPRHAAPALRKSTLLAEAPARRSTVPNMMTTMIANTNIFLSRTWESLLKVALALGGHSAPSARPAFPRVHGALVRLGAQPGPIRNLRSAVLPVCERPPDMRSQHYFEPSGGAASTGPTTSWGSRRWCPA